jgi:hypothetical protein
MQDASQRFTPLGIIGGNLSDGRPSLFNGGIVLIPAAQGMFLSRLITLFAFEQKQI